MSIADLVQGRGLSRCGYANVRERDGGFACEVCGATYPATWRAEVLAMVGEKEYAKLEKERREHESRA